MIFKYLGVVLDDTLSFNDHVDYVRMKVSKTLRKFSRIRPSLTLEAANRLYKAMVLPVLDYCDAVWHECGQGNSDKIERLQRRAARIVYFKAASKLSTDQIMTKLGLEPLYYKRRPHILRFVNECIANRVPRYIFNYFNVRNRDIHRHKTRNNNDLMLEKVSLEWTKRAFFSTKVQRFLIILRIYNCSNLPFSVTILCYGNLIFIHIFIFFLFFIFKFLQDLH